jgi:hypothetical protein
MYTVYKLGRQLQVLDDVRMPTEVVSMERQYKDMKRKGCLLFFLIGYECAGRFGCEAKNFSS